jgi:hypothetical protein
VGKGWLRYFTQAVTRVWAKRVVLTYAYKWDKKNEIRKNESFIVQG